jgi:hypothetical protein
MRVEDLHHDELLELDPEGGVIRFAGQRALVLDAVAMGILRQYLVENFGLVAARAVLTQFGFAHGWRMAEAMQKEFKWASNDEWRRAGPRLYTLEGLFRTQAGSEDPLTPKGAMVLASYEAEQHLLHFGRSDSAVCWTICGLMSGYFSRTNGKEVYVLEDRCLGEGHAACHLLGRTREEWGDERAEELTFFDSGRLKECLDVSLSRVTESLKAAEEKLRAHRQAVVRVAHDVEEPLGIVAKSTKMLQVVDLARRVAKVDAQCSSLVRAVREKRESRVSSTTNQRGPLGRSLPSTAAPSPRLCSRVSSLVTSAARSPVRLQTGPGCSRRPTTGLCCWTRSVRSHRACRSSSCGCSRSGRSVGSGRTRAGRLMFACWPPQTAILPTGSQTAPSARTSTTGSRSSSSTFRRSATAGKTSCRSPGSAGGCSYSNGTQDLWPCSRCG